MQSEAVRELVTAANQARVILRVGGYKRSTSKCAATRLDHALAAVEAEEEVSFAEAMRRKVVAGGFEEPAVKAEEKPQTHRPAALPHYTDRDEIAENDGRTWGNK